MSYKLFLYIIVIIIASALAYIYFPAASPESEPARIIAAFSIATLIAEVGAIWFLLTSLHAFKRKLKIAYALVVAGISTYALFLVPSIASVFGIGISESVQPILSLTPYAFGAILLFMGVRLFAKQLDVRGVWSSFWFVAGCSLALAVIAALLSRSPFPSIPQETYSVVMGLIAWSAGFNIATAIVAVHIRRRLGGGYKNATQWLLFALAMLALAGLHEVLVKGNGAVLSALPQYFSYSFWPYLVTALLFLQAGISFKYISKKYGSLSEQASYIDIIIYTAQLASNAHAIDPMLDKVRTITADHSSDTLSPENKAALLAVYMQLEDYLIHKEPLLNLTTDELRARLPSYFVDELHKIGE